ncbi:hypothetical protein JY97_08805 [Alkalispirochaeta odontotermitis]|nr:hypothetical protein JY97_08805 [Alkalispirochaeta odontotermitis]
MRFVSTLSPEKPVSFTEAILTGLAPDGALYYPEYMPNLSDFFWNLPGEIPFNELASNFTSALLSPEIDPVIAGKIVQDAFNFRPVLKKLSDDISILELFHGPSLAFKDFGASFLASAMNLLLGKQERRAIILTATSGDTGGAVAHAFHKKANIDVVILYPSGRISPFQEKQLTTTGGNVFALEVRGEFDDCQRLAKAAFSNPKLKKLPLTSANSINIGRLFPQSFYYIWAWIQMRDKGDPTFVVPSGNFGNLTAGLYAEAWGLPTGGFVAATNANDVVPEFLLTGKYRPKPSVPTYSNAMDVGSPSNYERLEKLFSGNIDIFRQHIKAWSIDDETVLKTISKVYQNHGYLCCPHTAVGWKAAELFKEQYPNSQVLVLSTAHPAKFLDTVKRATGIVPNLPKSSADIMQRKKIAHCINACDEDLAEWLIQNFN